MPNKSALRKSMKRSMKKRKSPTVPTAALTAKVERVLNRKLETKYRFDYSGQAFPAIGYYPGTAQGHNGTITNVSDIHRMIPQVQVGDTQVTRTGIKLEVLKLQADLDFSIRADALGPFPTGWNLMFVVYIWQHKQYKSYSQLAAGNNWAQFLDRGDGTTGSFSGISCDAKLPLSKDHYKLCKKYVFPIRTDGSTNGQQLGTVVSNTNSAPFQKRISVDLTKFIPKKLQYVVQPTGTPAIDDFPTNASLAMSVGFYNMDLVLASDVITQPLCNVSWVTKVTYKDA